MPNTTRSRVLGGSHLLNANMHTHTHARTHSCTHARTHARTQTQHGGIWWYWEYTHTHTQTHLHSSGAISELRQFPALKDHSVALVVRGARQRHRCVKIVGGRGGVSGHAHARGRVRGGAPGAQACGYAENSAHAHPSGGRHERANSPTNSAHAHPSRGWSPLHSTPHGAPGGRPRGSPHRSSATITQFWDRALATPVTNSFVLCS